MKVLASRGPFVDGSLGSVMPLLSVVQFKSKFRELIDAYSSQLLNILSICLYLADLLLPGQDH